MEPTTADTQSRTKQSTHMKEGKELVALPPDDLKAVARRRPRQHIVYRIASLSLKVAALALFLSLLLGFLEATTTVLNTQQPRSIRSNVPRLDDYLVLLEAQLPRLEELIDGNVEVPGLLLRFREGEMATSDLANLVSAAELADSGLISHSLRRFIEEMKATRSALSRFSTTIGGAVDVVVAVNSLALTDIRSGLRSEPRSIFSRDQSQIVKRAYLDSLLTLSTQVHRISDKTEAALRSIHAMRGRLLTLRDLISVEVLTLGDRDSDELLSLLWEKLRPSRLAANRDRRLKRLRELSVHLTVAVDRLERSSQVVESMRLDMEGMWQMLSGSKAATNRMTVVPQIGRIEARLEDLQRRRNEAKRTSEEIMDWILSSVEEDEA